MLLLYHNHDEGPICGVCPTAMLLVLFLRAGIIKGYQTARANMELYSYQAFALAR